MSTPEHGTIYEGDCLDIMRQWPAGCVDCCVTSPPYWGLRDYGTADWEGGDPKCDHMVDRFATPVSGKQASNAASGSKQARDTCPKCGARRVDRQIGLEQTPDEYVAKMVAVFGEVRRVLKDSGTLWLNLGDSYTSGGRTSRDPGQSKLHPAFVGDNYSDGKRADTPPGCKPKDLIGIPWLVAFALRADGWYLRSDIIWHKPNPMPESVKDRPTSAHEHIFLLSKSDRYWYDWEAIADPVKPGSLNRVKMPDGWDTGKGAHGKFHREGREKGAVRFGGNKGDASLSNNGRSGNDWEPNTLVNARNVWSIATKPYSGAHFATFPPELPTKCIMAGCPPGGMVLDPFFGSGTTGMVAEQLGRKWVGIELNPEYVAIAKARTAQQGLFT